MPITLSEKSGVRYLHFGTPWIQGAMRIARPTALELEYTRDLMAPLLFRGADGPRHVLQVGLGAGSITKFLHRHWPQAKLTVLEIDPAVVAAAHQYFRLPAEGPRLRIVIADAVDYLAAKDRRFDLVVLDGFDDHGRPGRLDSLPFYLDCKRHLAPSGLVSVNLLARTRGAKASVERLREAFDGRVLALPPSEAGNIVALAAADDTVDETYVELREAARALKARTGLDLAPLLARLRLARGGTRLALGPDR